MSKTFHANVRWSRRPPEDSAAASLFGRAPAGAPAAPAGRPLGGWAPPARWLKALVGGRAGELEGTACPHSHSNKHLRVRRASAWNLRAAGPLLDAVGM